VATLEMLAPTHSQRNRTAEQGLRRAREPLRCGFLLRRSQFVSGSKGLVRGKRPFAANPCADLDFST